MAGSSPLSPDTIDRIAPSRRPNDRAVMRQNWNDLLFLHWSVPLDVLRQLVPAELAIDTFDGRAYVGLVPFTMTGVRPVWSPSIPGLSNFHETNVRTYVHLHGRNPGVWFFSLDAANAIAVRIARAVWRLPYYYARMRLDHKHVTIQSPTGTEIITLIQYSTERLWPQPLPAVCTVAYTSSGPVAPALAGSLEHFLAERYILYTQDSGRIYSGQVHHHPYPLQSAEVQFLEENMVAAAGIKRSDDRPIVHYARGVSVDVFPLRPIVGRSQQCP